MEVFEQVVLACRALDDKKAQDITVIDAQKVSSITNYVVIATATSNTQARALLDNVTDSLEKEGIVAYHKEGYGQSDWAVVDFGDFIVHVFTKELREYYNLEKLYQDGKNLRKFESILKDLLEKERKEKKQSQKQEKQTQKALSKQTKKETQTETKAAKKQTKPATKSTKEQAEKPSKPKVEKKETSKPAKKSDKKSK